MVMIALTPLNIAVIGVAIASTVMVAIGMFGHVQGGGLPSNMWFGWHPVLMSLGFLSFMPLGRWSYLTQESLSTQRAVHGTLMGLGTLAMLGGYLAIFQAHLPMSKFFGYDFKNKAWGEGARVAHSLIGYLVVLAVVAQAPMGALKMRALGTGRRTLTFHGTLGKAILLLACVNVMIAIRFWAWSGGMKALLYLLTLATAAFCLWPRPAKPSTSSDSEEASLVSNGP